MATNQILITHGTPIVWADETDYAGGSQVGGTRTHDLDLTNLLFSAARQGVKVDLTANHAEEYSITLAVEFKTAEAPEDGETVDWRCELAAATTLKGRGWTQETLVPGMEITVIGNPARREDNVCFLSSFVPRGGKEVRRNSNVENLSIFTA